MYVHHIFLLTKSKLSHLQGWSWGGGKSLTEKGKVTIMNYVLGEGGQPKTYFTTTATA